MNVTVIAASGLTLGASDIFAALGSSVPDVGAVVTPEGNGIHMFAVRDFADSMEIRCKVVKPNYAADGRYAETMVLLDLAKYDSQSPDDLILFLEDDERKIPQEIKALLKSGAKPTQTWLVK